MEVSVVVCTYSPERFEDLKDCVESLLAQTYDEIEIVVVVDGTQSVFTRVNEQYGDQEDIVVHCNDDNLGLLESRNTGARVASGDVVAFIDDDAVADERWVEELAKSYEAHDALAVGGRMTPIWVDGKPRFLPEEFYWLVGVTHRGFAEEAGWVRNTFGSNISFRRDVFLEVGGFDSNIGGRKGDKNLQGGETELCARLAVQKDERVWYNPSATVGHKVFDYRTNVRWLLDRAFWQGYSKRAMESIVPGSGGEEGRYLHRLFLESTPDRIRGLIRSPSSTKVLQFLALFAFTGAVGLGYVYGMVKW